MRPVFLAIAAIGCAAPSEAPEELNELTAFIFEHAQDEDTQLLQQGVSNLEEWMTKRLEETKDGYVVDNLTTESVGQLDQCTRDISGLIGAAVGSTSTYSVEELVEVQLNVSPARLKDSTTKYRRELLLNDEQCFTANECGFLHYDSFTKQKFALGIETNSVSRVQWRWVEMDDGYAIVQRTWLALPLKASPAWFDVKEQFYLNVLMPRGERSVRLQAVWAVTEIDDAPVPENMALHLAINQMQDDAELYDEWLDEH